MHKVRATVRFASLEAYQDMKQALDRAGLQFDGFVTNCVNDTWNKMLDEYQQFIKAQQDAYTSAQSSGDSESVQVSESSDSSEQALGNSASSEEGRAVAAEG